MWIILALAIAFLYLIAANLPYLPGPDEYYRVSNSTFNLLQILSILLLLGLPVGLVWTVIELIPKTRKFRFPLTLLVIPLFTYCNLIYFSSYIRDIARDRSIQEASELISAIESYQ